MLYVLTCSIYFLRSVNTPMSYVGKKERKPNGTAGKTVNGELHRRVRVVVPGHHRLGHQDLMLVKNAWVLVELQEAALRAARCLQHRSPGDHPGTRRRYQGDTVRVGSVPHRAIIWTAQPPPASTCWGSGEVGCMCGCCGKVVDMRERQR